ncbi:MAG: LysR family transcriptional regulator [Candidatus Nanopelagicales bacterium]
MTYLEDLTVQQLLTLRAIAEEGSFGGAADVLRFSQSAVSQQAAALEKSVGHQLFVRPKGPKPATLTQAGRILLDHADLILARLDLIAQDLDDLAAGTKGRVVCGTFQSVSVELLPTVVGQLLLNSPGVEVELIESQSNAELIELLVSGKLDVSFLVGPVDDPRLQVIELGQDPMVLLAPRHDELLMGPDPDLPRKAVPIRELHEQPFIAQQEESDHVRVETSLLAAGIKPRYVFRTNDNGAVQAMVRTGAGYSIMPKLTVDETDPDIRIMEIDPPLPKRTIVLALRKKGTRIPALQTFIELSVAASSERLDAMPHDPGAG